MALVICCVLRTELIRLRIALSVAMRHFRLVYGSAFRVHPKRETRNLSLEHPFKLFQRLRHLGTQIAVQLALF